MGNEVRAVIDEVQSCVQELSQRWRKWIKIVETSIGVSVTFAPAQAARLSISHEPLVLERDVIRLPPSVQYKKNIQKVIEPIDHNIIGLCFNTLASSAVMMYCLRRQVRFRRTLLPPSIPLVFQSTNAFSYSYIPLLLLPLPLSFSPLHLTTLLILTYILNRPCIYCSLLLTILFASSCHWSGKCLWEAPITSVACSDLARASTKSAASSWAAYFIPRLYAPSTSHACTTFHNASHEGAMAAFLSEITNSTVSGMAAAAKDSGSVLLESVKQKIVGEATTHTVSASGGIGTQWLKSLLGRSEWTLPCVGVKLVI